MKLLFLDTETTGLSEPRLVQLAYHIHGSSLFTVGTFKPPKLIEIEATMLHGITNEEANQTKPFQGSPDFELLQNLLNDYILVCHNVVFDARVLQNEGLKIKKSLCTKVMAQKIYSNDKCHKLQHLRYTKNLKVEGIPHSALGDVFVMKKLFDIMVDEIEKRYGQEQVLSQISQFIVNHD